MKDLILVILFILFCFSDIYFFKKGIQAVVSRIKENYYIKNCFKVIKQYIENCESCQRNNPSTSVTPLTPIIPSGNQDVIYFLIYLFFTRILRNDDV